MMTDEEFLQACQEWRGVEDPCPECQGSGIKSYSSTSLWRRGVGGQAFTNGVCDKCWGSGDSNRPWTDLRKLEATFDERVRGAAEAYITGRAGSRYYPKLVAELLESQTRKRKGASIEYKQVCQRLADAVGGMGKP